MGDALGATSASLVARSLVDVGDTTRLQGVFAKAQRGEPVTVGVIGGSITQGASASTPDRRYGNLVAAWWRRQFPHCDIQFVNAGIGATGSDYGALRARRDLLSHKPDFVVVEYGVNDGNTRQYAESLEGLIRQILQSPGRPAIVLLFTMHNDGSNAQEWQGKLGRHYQLPMISFRDALWPEIQAGRMKWEAVEADVVHPNDRGHAYAAEFVNEFLMSVLRARPSTSRPATSQPHLPEPMISDLFERTTLWEADDLKPVSNQGWIFDAKEHCWRADKPASVIEFDVSGTAVLTMHSVIRGPMGRASVSVDGKEITKLEGWFDQVWGGYRQTNLAARGLAPGNHRVRVEVLADRSPQSSGNEFKILGLGTCGK